MENYSNEGWVDLYRTAMLELEYAKMSGRIEAARTAIVARVQKLQEMPELHPDERQAIADAISGLRVLQHEQTQHDAARLAIDKALEKMRYIAPAFLRTKGEQENPD
jgi:hypothetical protein